MIIKGNSPYLRIGITGGIGSGKSIVARLFLLEGIPVYFADVEAKRLMNENYQLRLDIISAFGEESYQEGMLNRTHIAKVISMDKVLYAKLNTLVHPHVAIDFERWASMNHTGNMIAKEAALLFESGTYKKLDRIINVVAPIEVRLRRVLQRDIQRPISQIREIMATQWTDAARIKKSDFNIYNYGENSVLQQFLYIKERLQSDQPTSPDN